MALIQISSNSDPTYVALSSDIVDNKIPGASLIGKRIFLSDTGAWKIIEADLTLSDYTLPVSVTVPDITIESVGIDQTTPGTTNGVVTAESAAAADNLGDYIAVLQAPGSVNSAPLAVFPYMFDGTAWDKVRGDSTNGMKVYGSLTVEGGLTDEELRATPVPVSGPLTDTELRATPIEVTGTLTSGGGAVVIRPTITISASPDYSIGDSIGGIITLSSVMADSGGKAELKSINVVDKSGQSPALSIYFFKATPSAGTYTDNAALVWGSGDGANCVGLCSIAAADYKTLAGISSCNLSGVEAIHDSATTDLYALIVADGAYNAASTSDLIITFGYERK